VSHKPPTSLLPLEAAKTGPGGEHPAVDTPVYKDSASGLEKIQTEYEYWTGALTKGSFELSVALIAANWAVFGSVERILKNFWSKGSILLVVVNLALSLRGARLMSEWLYRRWKEAQTDPEKWLNEWQEAARTDKPWPFTQDLESLGKMLRFFKTWLPLLSGLFFLFGLLSS
jgi:hypothetical protein